LEEIFKHLTSTIWQNIGLRSVYWKRWFSENG